MTWSAQEFAEAVGSFRREIAGIARRMVTGITEGGIWQMLGHLGIDPSAVSTKRETRQVENYPGIGFFARPPDNNGSAEGIVINVGGQNNPALVATRDEATRAKVDDIAPDEATAYNSEVRLYLKADGTIEARAHSGVAVAVALKSDVDALATYISTELTLPVTGATAGPVAAPTPPAAVGTVKFKAQ